MPFDTDQKIDRFELHSLQSEDSQYKIFLAHDTKFDRQVQIYLFQQHPEQAEVFNQTIRTMTNWRHAGLARLFDYGEIQSQIYLVQEDIPGQNLKEIMQKMRQEDCWINLQEAVLIIKELALAVDFAHQRGVHHGDISPGFIKFKHESQEMLAYQPVLLRTGIGRSGANLAPPVYRAPEILRGGSATKAADIFALGALLYELCTSQPPTPQNQVSSGPAQVLAPHLLHSDLPEWLEKVILKSLSPNPSDRFEHAGDLASALNPSEILSLRIKGSPSGISRSCQMNHFIQAKLNNAEPVLTDPKETPISAKPARPTFDLSQDIIYVLMPDKSVQNFKMKPDGLTIGRSAENDISIDLSGVSRKHARIDFDGQNYLIRDLKSLNGTFLEKKRLPAETPHNWLPGENLRIGDAWLRVERQSQLRTTQAVVSRELPTTPISKGTLPETDEVYIGKDGETIGATQVFRSAGLGWVAAHSESLNISVAPGSSTEVPILMFNRGPAADTFLIHVHGIPTEWIQKSPQSQRVPAHGQREIQITISPPRTAQVKAGRYAMLVRLTSQNSSNQYVELRLTLTVTAYSLFSSEIQPDALRANETGQVIIHNRGNLQETFHVIWEDRTHTLVFDPPQVKLNLQVGKSAVIDYRPTLKKPRLLGSEVVFPYKVHISSQAGQNESHNSQFLSRGVLPGWAPFALITLILMLACVIGLLVDRVTGPVRHAEQTSQAVFTQIALGTETANYLLTATSLDLANANQATLQAATATGEYLLLDEDQDGLSNQMEITANTLTNVADSDQDGLLDGKEVLTYKTNPLAVDTDEDGLWDGDEVRLGTDPLKRDTDGDGINDSVDPDPLNYATLPPVIYLPTSTPLPFYTHTPKITNTPTNTPLPRYIDLSIQVSNGETASIPGTITNYVIVVMNKGPAKAVSAQVIDQFPVSLSNISWTCTASPGSRCLNINGSGNINSYVDLIAGGTATFSINARIKPDANGQLINSARVISPSELTEQKPFDNQATDTDNLTPRAALSLNKTDRRDTVLPGQSTTYKIVVINNGPSTVSGINVQDNFPAQLKDITWNCRATQGSVCTASGTQAGNINSLISLNPSGTITFTANTTVRTSASGTIINSASIISPVDPAANNKTATDTTTIIPQADLRVNVSAPLTVTASTTLTYTITITNAGPSTATGIQLTNTLTNTVSFISTNPGTPTCEHNSGVVLCDLGSLTAGGSMNVLIRVTAPALAGAFPNIVEIRGNEPDPNPANDSQTTVVVST